MQKSIVVFILIWSNFYFSYAQKINIQGVISEQNTNNVVEGASVFIIYRYILAIHYLLI